MLWQRRLVVVADDYEFFFAVVKDLQEEHPAELFEPLRIAVGTGVLAHDVLDGFDDVGYVRHEYYQLIVSLTICVSLYSGSLLTGG